VYKVLNEPPCSYAPLFMILCFHLFIFVYIVHLLNVILKEVDFYILVTTKINLTRKTKIAAECGK